MKCPDCSSELGVTIATPNFTAAYKELEEAKSLIEKIKDEDLRNKLQKHLKNASDFLRSDLVVALRSLKN